MYCRGLYELWRHEGANTLYREFPSGPFSFINIVLCHVSGVLIVMYSYQQLTL